MIVPIEIADAHEPLSVPGSMSSPENIPPSGACGWCGALFGRGYPCVADPSRKAAPACLQASMEEKYWHKGDLPPPEPQPHLWEHPAANERQVIVSWLGEIARGNGATDVRIAALRHLADIAMGMRT